MLCALVLHHLRDRHRFLGEVYRILRPGGWFVVSSTHPTADWGRFGGSYFEQRWVTRPLDDQHSIEYQLIPLSVLVNQLLESGFVLDKMIEPQPSPDMKQADPQRYEELRAAPIFLAPAIHGDAFARTFGCADHPLAAVFTESTMVPMEEVPARGASGHLSTFTPQYSRGVPGHRGSRWTCR